jgi:hypothetical protein
MQVHPDSQVSPPICSIDVGDFPGPGNNCPDRAELSTQKISRNCLDSRGLGFFKALAVLGLQAFFFVILAKRFLLTPKPCPRSS